MSVCREGRNDGSYPRVGTLADDVRLERHQALGRRGKLVVAIVYRLERRVEDGSGKGHVKVREVGRQGHPQDQDDGGDDAGAADAVSVHGVGPGGGVAAAAAGDAGVGAAFFVHGGRRVSR